MIALNNNGVSTLVCGRVEDAILSFRHALECAKSLMADVSSGNDCIIDEEVVLLRAPLNFMDKAAVVASPNNMFDIYQRAFYLPKSEDRIARSISQVFSVLLYNLALAHHAAGLIGTENIEAHLFESLKYYKLAIKTYRCQPDSAVDRTALVLGCVTNMGFVYSHFWRIKEARSCTQLLGRMLASSEVMSITDGDGEFFFATLSYCSTQKCSLAPAA